MSQIRDLMDFTVLDPVGCARAADFLARTLRKAPSPRFRDHYRCGRWPMLHRLLQKPGCLHRRGAVWLVAETFDRGATLDGLGGPDSGLLEDIAGEAFRALPEIERVRIAHFASPDAGGRFVLITPGFEVPEGARFRIRGGARQFACSGARFAFSSAFDWRWDMDPHVPRDADGAGRPAPPPREGHPAPPLRRRTARHRVALERMLRR